MMTLDKWGLIIGLIGGFFFVVNDISSPLKSQKRTKFITNLSGVGKNPLKEYDRILKTTGFIFITIGVALQIV